MASHTADFKHERLDDHAKGDALALIKYGLQRTQEQGLVATGEPKLDPRITGADPVDQPTSIEVVDCVDDTEWLRHKRGSAPGRDTVGGHSRAEATVVLIKGFWKVSELYTHPAGTC